MKYESAADAYAYLGMIEMDRENMDLSREYYKKSIVFSGQSQIQRLTLHMLITIKRFLHFNLGEMDSSLMYFEKSLRLRERINHKKGIIESYFNLGILYMETGDAHNAYINLNKSTELAKKYEFKGDELDALQNDRHL